jgi:hypothetical protein
MDINSLTIGAITLAPPLLALPKLAITYTFVKDYWGLSVCFRCGSSAYKVKNYTKLVSSSSSKRVTIAVVNDDDYSSNSDSEGYKLPPELD